MPLSSLSTVNTALNNIYDTAKTAPMPLDAIEARRASNQAERLAEYEAGTQRLQANEYGASGQATRATQASTALVLKTIGPPPKDTRSPEYAQWLRESAGILISSGDEGAMKLGNEMLSRVEAASNTGRLDPDTQKGAQAAAGIDLDRQRINESKSVEGFYSQTPRRDVRAPTDNEIAMRLAGIKLQHEAETGGGLLNKWFNSLSQTEKLALTRKMIVYENFLKSGPNPMTLTDEQMLDDIKSGVAEQRMGAANTGGSPNLPMPSQMPRSSGQGDSLGLRKYSPQY